MTDPWYALGKWRRGRRVWFLGEPIHIWIGRGPWDDLAVTWRTPEIASVSLGVALLWAIALEVDEHGATLTGERVCARCDGTGEAPESDEEYRERIKVNFTFNGGPMIRRAVVDCPCDCPTRPDTVQLAHLVAQLASQRSPVVADWPAAWLVDLDAMEAAGWGATWLPSQGDRPTHRVTMRIGSREVPTPAIDGYIHASGGSAWDRTREPAPAWICRWWQAFREWTTTGREPDADALALLLAARVEARRERVGHECRLASTAAPGDGLADALDEFSEAFRSGALAAGGPSEDSPSEDSLRATLLRQPGVHAVEIRENLTSAVDPLGIPPHSVEIVYDGDASEADVLEVARQVVSLVVGVVVFRRNLSRE